MDKPFSAMLKFEGTLRPSFKDDVCLALFGRTRPEGLKVVHVRHNSNGHTIRLSGKINSDVMVAVYKQLFAQTKKEVPCADGVLRISGIGTRI